MTPDKTPEFNYALLRQPNQTEPVRLLIEASAGTGKTYTLERIIVHYLLHSDYDLENILLVTFTNKAARELRVRIRSILADMLDKPAFAAAIFSEIGLPGSGDWGSKLRQQQRNFAAAPIHTIHGFSQSILKAYPVECNALINIRLDNNYPAELLRDYLRQTLLEGILPIPGSSSLTGETLSLCLDQAMNLFGCTKAEDLISRILKIKYQGAFDPKRYRMGIPGSPDLATAWNLLIPGHVQALQQILSDDSDPLPLTPVVQALNLALVQAFPDYMTDTGLDVADFCRRTLGLNFVRFLLEGLESYRDRQPRFLGIMNYDDQIAKLDHASREGGLLLPRLQEQFKLILIDEFQDTDRIQWGIFRRIAGSSGHLIAVGDPKQAIYGFRGADLNTYLSARRELSQTCRLSRNFRSSHALVSACNKLFDGIFNQTAEPDFAPRLEHLPVAPGVLNSIDRSLLDRHGQAIPVLNGIFFEPDDWKSNRLLEDRLTFGIIASIQGLLSGAAILNAEGIAKNLSPADICILTQDNSQARRLQQELNIRGIPARVSGQGKLFDTAEADDLQILLDAVQEPAKPAMVRRLVLTRFFGISPLELRSWQGNDGLGRYQEICARWHADFARNGLEGILAELEDSLRARLLLSEGQAATRSLTNFRHLADLFQQHSQGNHIPAGRIGLAFRELRSLSQTLEEDSLRLDSDTDMVSIMTMHSAKGLEFPIVFLFGGFRKVHMAGQTKDTLPTLDQQNPAGDWFQTIDPWASSAGKLGHFHQEWEAWLRLIYVAATRAKSALFLPAWRSPGKRVDSDRQIAFLYDRGLISSDILQQWPDLDTNRPAPPHTSHPAALELGLQNVLPKLPAWPTERQSSFTSLSHHGPGLGQLAPDQLFQSLPEPGPELMEPTVEIQAEPGGTQYGTIFHAAMEHLDFKAYHGADAAGRDACLDRLFSAKLESLAQGKFFGFGFYELDSIREYLRQQLHQTLQTILSGPAIPSQPIHSLDSTRARREATFHSRIPQPASLALPARFQLRNRHLDPGYLTGSIDCLVPVEGRWCIIDWKTNRAGTGLETEIEQAMTSNEYHLQALIYQSAVHQWLCTRLNLNWHPLQATAASLGLAQRIFEEQMGPVWYVFVRYGKAVISGANWEELLEFQQKAELYASAI